MNEEASNIKTISGQKILKSRLVRGADGLKLELQSPVNWDFLKRAGAGQEFTLGGIQCGRPRSDSYNGLAAKFYCEDKYEYNEFPNLCVLLATNIKDGVIFNFGVHPFSEQKAKDFLINLKEAVKVLYLTYVRPIDLSIEISSKTVESEIHD